MKPTVPKTVHVDKRPSFAGNLVTIFAGRAERTAETMAMRQNLPGKSHVGRILLNDNTSQERLLDMRLSDIQNAQKKTATFIAHQKKTFVTRMEHRQNTWVREHSRRANILNSWANRKRDSIVADTESQDSAEDAVTLEKGKAVDASDDTNPNIRSVDTTKKESQEMSDSLPEICSTQKKSRIPLGKFNAKGTTGLPRNDLSLPNIQVSNLVDKSSNPMNGTKLPSVLITAEGDAEQANQESGKSNNAGNSVEIAEKKQPRMPTDTFEQPRLTGPSPTFISEVLPRIQIQERLRMPSHLSKKARRRRRRKISAKNVEEDPLEDDRFLRLQHTLAPHLAWQDTRDMASIAAGVVNAKKIVSEKLRKITRVDEAVQDD
ncbi:uncharacterized protein LOC110973596 isoform X2 [Acanthaster planci]|nr:uncharacterized protein LOC110973596 isoform X2 [Acanthaster planci]